MPYQGDYTISEVTVKVANIPVSGAPQDGPFYEPAFDEPERWGTESGMKRDFMFVENTNRAGTHAIYLLANSPDNIRFQQYYDANTIVSVEAFSRQAHEEIASSDICRISERPALTFSKDGPVRKWVFRTGELTMRAR